MRIDTQPKNYQNISKLSTSSDHNVSIVRVDSRRIVNGHDVNIKGIKNNIPIHSYPWMVRLSENKDTREVFCGGTLISKKHVITAAHCMIKCSMRASKCKVKGACRKNEINCSKYKMNWAILGDYDRSKRNQGEVYKKIKCSIEHPNTHQPNPEDDGAFEYDFSIVILKYCVHFTDNIKPADLPTNDKDTYEQEMVTVIGWGHMSWKENNDPLAAKSADILQYINITVLSEKSCKERAQTKGANKRNVYNSSHLMCAGDVENWRKDACTSDSGRK